MKFSDFSASVSGDVVTPRDAQVVVRVDDLLIVATAFKTELVGDREFFVIETHPHLDKEYLAEVEAGLIPLGGTISVGDSGDDVDSPVPEDPS